MSNSRFNSPETDTLLEEMMDLRLSDSRPSKSSSTILSSGGASSSKAVLAALKALQEKIRKLESERAQFTDEIAALKNQIKSQEIEAEHTRQRDNLANMKAIHELKTANERLDMEKQSLEKELAKLEAKNKERSKSEEAVLEKMSQLQEGNEALRLRCKELEATMKLAETQAGKSQQREKGS